MKFVYCGKSSYKLEFSETFLGACLFGDFQDIKSDRLR